MIKEIFFYIISLLLPQRDTKYLKGHMIDTKYVPRYIYWIDQGNVLLSSFGYTEIYNIDTRKSNTVETCDSCMYGYDFGLYSCKYVHRDISNTDEFSTTIYQYNTDGVLIFQKDIFETVIPLVCKKEYILLETGDPMLIQNRYILKTETGEYEIYERERKRERIDGIEERYITVSKPKNEERLILLDNYYRLWVYEKCSQ